MANQQSQKNRFQKIENGQFISISPNCLGVRMTNKKISIEFGVGNSKEEKDEVDAISAIEMNFSPSSFEIISNIFQQVQNDYVNKYSKPSNKTEDAK